jgi:hypothetical protein
VFDEKKKFFSEKKKLLSATAISIIINERATYLEEMEAERKRSYLDE